MPVHSVGDRLKRADKNALKAAFNPTQTPPELRVLLKDLKLDLETRLLSYDLGAIAGMAGVERTKSTSMLARAMMGAARTRAARTDGGEKDWTTHKLAVVAPEEAAKDDNPEFTGLRQQVYMLVEYCKAQHAETLKVLRKLQEGDLMMDSSCTLEELWDRVGQQRAGHAVPIGERGTDAVTKEIHENLQQIGRAHV